MAAIMLIFRHIAVDISNHFLFPLHGSVTHTAIEENLFTPVRKVSMAKWYLCSPFWLTYFVSSP